MKGRWESGEEVETKDSGNGKKHGDAPKNIKFFEEFINRKHIMKALKDYNAEVVYHGINKNKDGNYEELTGASVYWKHKGIPYGVAVAFHQPHNTFIPELNKAFGIRI